MVQFVQYSLCYLLQDDLYFKNAIVMGKLYRFFGVNLTQSLAVPKDMGTVDKRHIMQPHQIFDLHLLLAPLQVHPRK